MRAQVNSLTVIESQCEPQEVTGRRITFPVCFSTKCRTSGAPYITNDGEKGTIKDTKKDYCPQCRDVLFWVTQRK
jgi:hypothetical protein